MHTPLITREQWITAEAAWAAFVAAHPELGYRQGRWPLYNFLRLRPQPSSSTLARDILMDLDALRKVRTGHWIARAPQFDAAAFDIVTGAAVPCHPPLMASEVDPK